MKKVLVVVFLSLMLCKAGFAESYYFKECKISNAVIGNYTINLQKNIIEVENGEKGPSAINLQKA